MEKYENILKNINQIDGLFRALERTKTQLMDSLRSEYPEILPSVSDFKWSVFFDPSIGTKLIGNPDNERTKILLELVNHSVIPIFTFDVEGEMFYPMINNNEYINIFGYDNRKLFKFIESINAANAWSNRDITLEIVKSKVKSEKEVLNLHQQFLNLLQNNNPTSALDQEPVEFTSINWKSEVLPKTIKFSVLVVGKQGTIIPVFQWFKEETFSIGWLSRRPSDFAQAARIHSTELKSVIAFYELDSLDPHTATLQWDARHFEKKNES